MNFGRATNFTTPETPETRTRKLNDMMASVYAIFQQLVPSAVIPIAQRIFGHTSEMPDQFGLNKDHDKRYLTKVSFNSWLLTILAGFGTIRITNADSPYTVLAGIFAPHTIFCDTDTGVITVNLPALVNEKYKIMNTGTSATDVTVVPNGADLLYGVNANETLYDQENFDLNGELTEGWA